MNYTKPDQVTVRLADGQRQWLQREANRQLSNISALVRQAIKLLQEKIEREEKK